MGYTSAPSQQVVRACGREYYFSKITFMLNKLQQGKTLAPKLQRRYAPWIEWLGRAEQAGRADFLAFILRVEKDCPAALLSIDIWSELMAVWAMFRNGDEGEEALLAELRLYDMLFPRAANVDWRLRLRVLAGAEQEEPLRFFGEFILERSNKVDLSDDDWNHTALRLLAGAKIDLLGQCKALASGEMRRFFALIGGKSRVPGIQLYQGCRVAVPELKENSALEHWLFSGLMTLFAESPYVELLCAKMGRPAGALAGRHWWYPWFQLWLNGEFPALARLWLPRQALELFRPLGAAPGEVILRNLPLFMLKKLPELMRNERDKQMAAHLAAGNNIRTARHLPFPLTKKMAHYFANLSDAADSREAFWLSFGMACGASAEIVRRFRQFWRLPEIREHYAFLQSAMAFAAQAGYEAAHLTTVVGYWRHAAHESKGLYSLCGRTPASVSREAGAFYQRTQNTFPHHKIAFWKAHPTVKPFVWQTESGQFTIVELTSSYDLYEEGRTLKHCVGTYTLQCRQGSSSIWSLRYSDGVNKMPVVTIELDAAGRIVQSRGPCNRLPVALEMLVIKKWAEEQGLRVC